MLFSCFRTDVTRAALLRCNRARTGHPAHRVFCDPIRHGTPRSLRPARRADRSDEDMHRASVPYPSRHIWRPGRRGSDSRKLSVLEPPSRRPPRRRRRLCRRHLIPPTNPPPYAGLKSGERSSAPVGRHTTAHRAEDRHALRSCLQEIWQRGFQPLRRAGVATGGGGGGGGGPGVCYLDVK